MSKCDPLPAIAGTPDNNRHRTPKEESGLNDIIFISMESWDEIWRRNQFVCAELSRRHPACKILFVGVQRNFWRLLANGKIGPLVHAPHSNVHGYPSITTTRPLRLGLERYRWGRRINQWITRNHILRLAKNLGLKRPVLWLNPHYAIHLVGHCDESCVIYDITDDWISSDQAPPMRRLTEKQDATACAIADATIVCSQKLYDMKAPLSSNLHLIPNGVDAEHYAGVLDGELERLETTQEWKKPVFGYTGTIHPDRVDVDLLVMLAAAIPQATFALVGPNMLPAENLARLARCSNIRFTGAVPYADIPRYMSTFDVCITPHRVTPFTESLNPIKLWEYLAAGKPIVSTDVAGFRDYPQHVAVARNANEFAAALQAGLCEDPAKGQSRRAEARKHSWSDRVDKIEAVIENVLATKDQVPAHVG
jgi:glycosyltransferase involved in cell wall biosynthesis